MNSVAHQLLALAWLSALIGLVGGTLAATKNDRRWALVARNATIAVALASLVSTAGLGALFLRDEFTNQYVWQYSSRAMSPLYKLSALWGGMDGSMLLWALLLSIGAAWLALRRGQKEFRLYACALAAINSSSAFFLSVVLFVANPFRFIKAPFIPPDGNGLNPLLQNPLMTVHPPMLYAGFTFQAIPCALAVAALVTASAAPEWLRCARRWALFAWMLLTAGIVTGGYWAYIELGWGGFWAWDPVENASFLPWLASTAFLHSALAQEKKGRVGLWNLWLMILAYGLTVFGTFLTRSGLVQSVHAFAVTDMGWVFIVYPAVMILFCIIFSYRNGARFGSKGDYQGILSKDASLLFNNLLLLSLCFAVLWGVLFPVISEALTGQRQTVGIAYFNILSAPLFLALLLLMGVGPALDWKGSALSTLLKRLRVPIFAGAAAAILGAVSGIREAYPLAVLLAVFFSGVASVIEIRRVWQRRGDVDATTAPLLQSSGAHVAHLGVAVMGLAIMASVGFKVEREFSLERGQTYVFGRRIFQFHDLAGSRTANYESVQAQVQLFEEGDQNPRRTLLPEVRGYFKNQENTSEVALLSSWREDLYLVLTGVDDNGARASFKLFINPLQLWLWVGAVLVVLGGFFRWMAAGKRL